MMEESIPMPGSFLADVDQRMWSTLAKARPSLYIPPQSPSPLSSLSPSFVSPRVAHSYSGSRKRARYDSGLTNVQPTSQIDSDTDQTWACSTTSLDSLQSPAPLVSTRYRLAGGLDTPNALTTSVFANGQESGVVDYRPSRFSPQTEPVAAGYFPSTPDVLSRERNGRKRASSSPPYQGWGKAVCSMIGGVAGKVFNFCWTGAFRGFHAGGGKGYTMDISTPVVVDDSAGMDLEGKGDVFNQHYHRQQYQDHTHIPGEFPGEELTKAYMLRLESPRPQESLTPSGMGNKRPGGKLKSQETWVVVKSFDTYSRETSPTRKIPRTSTFGQTRPISRGWTAVRPRLTPSRPSRSSLAGSPTLSSDRPASFASPRRLIETSGAETRSNTVEGHQSCSQPSHASPRRSKSIRNSHTPQASPDVQQFEKRLRKKEKAQQDSIERLSQQTKDMIREARRALDTRIDVEDEAEIEDERYGEATELMSESKW